MLSGCVGCGFSQGPEGRNILGDLRRGTFLMSNGRRRYFDISKVRQNRRQKLIMEMWNGLIAVVSI